MAESTSSDIAKAVSTLTAGGLVAFATETVYGLGADATSRAAVRKIFAAKGRPPTNPLIVHVASESIARRYAAEWPDAAQILAHAFWPGPLTLVVAKTDEIVPEVTAGLNGVALRVPNHEIALQLLRAFDGPIAAPSANRSGRISPTTAQHVRDELGDRVDLILDGGPCQVGIESTVLDLTRGEPRILRPGQITKLQIEEKIGRIAIDETIHAEPGQAAPSPGLQAAHYSPATPAYRLESGEESILQRWASAHAGSRAVLLTRQGDVDPALFALFHVITLPTEAGEYAAQIYSALHAADRMGSAAVFIHMPPDTTEWRAVRDRLIRATRLPVQ